MNLKEIVNYTFPTSIDFGVGARHRIVQELKKGGLSRPLIVTDRTVATLRWFSDLSGELSKEGFDLDVYSEIWGNPLASHVLYGVDAAKAHRPDAIVAIGGGAAMDVAKAIALMLHHPGDLFNYEDGLSDARPINQPIPYLIAVPTTAGTGSEVGRSLVVSDDQSRTKKIIFSPRLLPKKVFADPELTIELPAHLTAATGMDALTHLVESYLAKGFHPICDGVAIEGVRMVATHLNKCVDYARTGEGRSERHLESRGYMLHAAIMGGIAFQKGLGATHSCAHALSSINDLHHGLSNGIMIPYVMRFNFECVPERFDRLSEAVSRTGGGQFLNWLSELKEEIGIPSGLTGIAVTPNQVEALIEYAISDSCHLSNPRSVSRQDFRNIFLEAMEH